MCSAHSATVRTASRSMHALRHTARRAAHTHNREQARPPTLWHVARAPKPLAALTWKEEEMSAEATMTCVRREVSMEEKENLLKSL